MNGVDTSNLWFIPALIAIYLIFPFIKKIFDEYIVGKSEYKKVIYFILIVILVLFFFPNFIGVCIKAVNIMFNINIDIKISNINIFNPFFHYGYLLFYFIIGGILHNWNINNRRIKISSIKLILIYLLGAIMLFANGYIESISTNTNYDIIFGGYSTIANILMAVSIFIIIYRIKYNKDSLISKVINTVGDNTLGIYYLHWLIGYTVLIRLYKDIYFTKSGIILNTLKAIFLVIICTVITYIYKLIKQKIKVMIKNYKSITDNK